MYVTSYIFLMGAICYMYLEQNNVTLNRYVIV